MIGIRRVPTVALGPSGVVFDFIRANRDNLTLVGDDGRPLNDAWMDFLERNRSHAEFDRIDLPGSIEIPDSDAAEVELRLRIG